MENDNTYYWWQTGIIYEVYARSFQDSNGDGIGDLEGIIQRLDYLQWLGITTVWLTPVYPSPMKDLGYDISDFQNIDPLFGDLHTFDRLLNAIHEKGMRLIIDLVPNHTSDQHPWFKESRSSKDNPKRNWYIWKDAKEDGSEPNNWLSVLGGPAWEWDAVTKQYYYHAFLKEQPDLNLRNPEVLDAILNIMRFWLNKGVDGFRIDVMWHLMKDEKFRDNPINPDYKTTMPDCDKLQQVFSCDQPEVHEVIRTMRKVLEEYGDKVMVGEIYLPVNKIVTYYGQDDQGAQLPANFQLLFIPWEAEQIALAVAKYEAQLPDVCWPNWVIGNHDRARLISRIGAAQTRIAAILLLMLRGTPMMYYGDEIGMEQVPIPPGEHKDPQGLLMPGKNMSRDPQRTPMQWNGTANAGFTKGKPWLRLAENYQQVNVAAQQDSEDSLLMFYKKLIMLRQKEPSLTIGDYFPVYTNKQIFSFTREKEGASSFLIVVNLTDKEAAFKPEHKKLKGIIELSTSKHLEGVALEQCVSLKGNEGIIVRLQ